MMSKTNKLEIYQAPSVSQVFQGRFLNGIKLKTTNDSVKNILGSKALSSKKNLNCDRQLNTK